MLADSSIFYYSMNFGKSAKRNQIKQAGGLPFSGTLKTILKSKNDDIMSRNPQIKF